jgi:hypothetical protein
MFVEKLILIHLVLVIYLSLTTINAMVFNIDYSLFGPYVRSAFPVNEKPRKRKRLFWIGLWSMSETLNVEKRTSIFKSIIIFILEKSFIRIGKFRAVSYLPARWTIYPSGLGIGGLAASKAFIPAECIKVIKFYQTTGQYELAHNSPEFYSPFVFWDSDLLKELVHLGVPAYKVIE